jgi:hypothetical protein
VRTHFTEKQQGFLLFDFISERSHVRKNERHANDDDDARCCFDDDDPLLRFFESTKIDFLLVVFEKNPEIFEQ